ncbi:hypothetical protein C8R44DRAFT_790462, partial [Mycena epipterygia]
DIELEESSLAGNSSFTEDIELVPTDPPGSRPKLSPMKFEGHNSSRRTPSGKNVPTNPCCGQEKLNNTKTICTICFVYVPRSEYSTTSVISGVLPKYKTQCALADNSSSLCEQKDVSETSQILNHTLAGWMFSAPNVALPGFAATLAAGAIMGIVDTLIMRRRV